MKKYEPKFTNTKVEEGSIDRYRVQVSKLLDSFPDAMDEETLAHVIVTGISDFVDFQSLSPSKSTNIDPSTLQKELIKKIRGYI